MTRKLSRLEQKNTLGISCTFNLIYSATKLILFTNTKYILLKFSGKKILKGIF